jgi:hypothetical protein
MSAPDHGHLPLRDDDHLPLSSLAARIRSLPAGQISELLEYERAHAHRPQAVQILEHRRDELERGAQPTQGSQQWGPDYPDPAAGGSPVTPATAAPPGSSPPHGEPDQPGQPKGDRQTRGGGSARRAPPVRGWP